MDGWVVASVVLALFAAGVALKSLWDIAGQEKDREPYGLLVVIYLGAASIAIGLSGVPLWTYLNDADLRSALIWIALASGLGFSVSIGAAFHRATVARLLILLSFAAIVAASLCWVLVM